MTDETTSAGEPITVVTADVGAPEEYTMNHAAKALADIRFKRNQPAESAEPATAETELSGEDNAAPLDEAHGEDEELDPAKEPSIERPKSWTDAEDAEWQSTPRALQQKIVARELERDTALRRTQNDAAEKLKGLTAKEQQAEQARQQYEAQLPALKQALLAAQSESFSDIKTWDDVKALQKSDPFRYQEWDVHQKELAMVDAKTKEAEARQAQEHQTEWATHVQKENALAAEAIPELADKVKGPALTQRAADRLAELGFKPEELNDLANGKQKLSIYDHRLQQLIFSDLKLSDIQKAPKAVAKTPVPPVQRPGTSKPSGSANSERVQALDNNLTSTGSLKAAQELRVAQLRSQRRAS